ncbi:hypothetical protein P8452_10363 [Trifolium repens]|nr:hypothetical protein P8452_10363 [Trifolium repens]
MGESLKLHDRIYICVHVDDICHLLIDTSTSTANPPPRSLLINASITALCSAVSSFSLYSLRRRFLRDSPLTLRRGVVVHRISLFTIDCFIEFPVATYYMN